MSTTPPPADTARILRRAAALVRAGWCQYCPARDSDGAPCDAWSQDARCWCAIGALRRAAWETLAPDNSRDCQSATLTARLRDLVINATPELGSLVDYNDARGRSWLDVAGRFERVATMLEARA